MLNCIYDYVNQVKIKYLKCFTFLKIVYVINNLNKMYLKYMIFLTL